MTTLFDETEKYHCAPGEKLTSVGSLHDHVALYKCVATNGVENPQPCQGAYITIGAWGDGCTRLKPWHLRQAKNQ